MTDNQIQQEFFFLRSGERWIKVPIADITHLEAIRNYTIVFIRDRPAGLQTQANMKVIFQRLPACFFRVHRSFIVSFDHIDYISTKAIVINDKTIPIGNAYKAVLANAVKLRLL
jgi:two-component system, LytTR family, response regulator